MAQGPKPKARSAYLQQLIPKTYRHFLERRRAEGARSQKLSFRAFWVGTFLSFFLAIGAPYGNMVIRGSYMALDFSTPGAIFLFLFLIGVLNLCFKLAARGLLSALLFAFILIGAYAYAFWPFDELDPHSPGLIFSTFVVITALLNVKVVQDGASLALNRSELILVYLMLLIVSALCTMGLSEQLLPMLTALFYYASPENEWMEKLLPHVPEHHILVDDGNDNRSFYEGISQAGHDIPFSAWVEPLVWWGIFLLALYVAMVCTAVILRRQWVERERLAYPITQVPLAMVRGEDSGQLVNGFFKSWAMWAGCSIPFIVGSLIALHRYNPAFSPFQLTWIIPFFPPHTLQLHITFMILGFSYLINTHVAAGIWFFYLLLKMEKAVLPAIGLQSEQHIVFGVSDSPFLAYQGVGALLTLVVLGLWSGREHLKNVVLKALGRAPHIDDGDEICSYRSAVIGGAGGVLVMVGWLWALGTPWWISLVFVVVAMMIFVGITRVVAEAGLAAVRTPMIAPDLLIQGLGSQLVGPTGVFNLSMGYMWSGSLRVFVMATCANGLKLVEEMGRPSRRCAFWSIILALLIGSLGACWMIFHTSYKYGGINLNSWFFHGAPSAVYDSALRNMEPSGIDRVGLGFCVGGGAAMFLLTWLRQRLLWWPVHPLGFPIGANSMMDYVWFSVFLAWLIKKLVLKYGGAGHYTRSQAFFLGLISGQALCNGTWLIVDYFTGKVGNAIFWV